MAWYDDVSSLLSPASTSLPQQRQPQGGIGGYLSGLGTYAANLPQSIYQSFAPQPSAQPPAQPQGGPPPAQPGLFHAGPQPPPPDYSQAPQMTPPPLSMQPVQANPQAAPGFRFGAGLRR